MKLYSVNHHLLIESTYIHSCTHVLIFFLLQLLPNQTQTPLWATVIDLLTLSGQLPHHCNLKQGVDKKRDYKCKSSSKVKASTDAGYKESVSDYSCLHRNLPRDM